MIYGIKIANFVTYILACSVLFSHERGMESNNISACHLVIESSDIIRFLEEFMFNSALSILFIKFWGSMIYDISKPDDYSGPI